MHTQQVSRALLLLLVAMSLHCGPAAVTQSTDSLNGPPGGDAAGTQGDEPYVGDSGSSVGDPGTEPGDPEPGDGDPGSITPGGDPPAGTDLVFIAQGHMGRTTISCDRGRSWIHNQSVDDSVRCGPSFDCNHHAWAAKNVIFANGHFLALYGHGEPNGIYSSPAGVNWGLLADGVQKNALAWVDGVLLQASKRTKRSEDFGMTWSDDIRTTLEYSNVRRLAYVNWPGGGSDVTLVATSSSAADVSFSNDTGLTWSAPSQPLNPACASNIQVRGGVQYGNGVIVIAGQNGDVCTTSNRGASWTHTDLNTALQSHLIWTGSEFWVFAEGVAYRSTDGVSFTTRALNIPDLRLGVMTHADGVFVAVNAESNKSYEDQAFYRSEDGINWTVLDRSKFVGSHPLRSMTWGYIDGSMICP